jgi:RNA polymerase sigma factor (sigma-70 family)
MRDLLTNLSAVLTPRELKICTLYFVEGVTQQKVGQTFGISQAQVHRITSAAVKKMRRVASEYTDGRNKRKGEKKNA